MAPLSTENIEALSVEEIRQVLLDLRVHQIELEVQNEELRSKHAELDAAHAHHFDFYDLAPVGYCTINAQGLILAANLTIATLLDVTRSALINQPITRFIHQEDQGIYYLHRKQLFESGEPQTCELRMVKKDKTTFWGHLTATAAQNADNTPVIRIVLSDITERKQTEEKVRSQLEELQRWQDVMLGREDRVQELKREVNELCRRSGETARYPSQEAGPGEEEDAV